MKVKVPEDGVPINHHNERFVEASQRKQFNSLVPLIKAHNYCIRSQRDLAAQDGNSRMDKDVYAERTVLKEGIPQDTPIVCLNLQKQFKDFVAIRDVSFHVPKQSVFALLGANGAAKTTTINIMVGLLQQTYGKVYLHGYDMSDQL